MNSRKSWFNTAGLLAAASGSVVVVLVALSDPLRATLVRPVTLVEAFVAAVLFLRTLLDEECRRGLDAANKAIQGARPFQFRRIRFLDSQWGIFGRRAGGRPLLFVRAILFAEFIVALVLSGGGGNDILLLAFASLLVATMLSLIHAGTNAPAA